MELHRYKIIRAKTCIRWGKYGSILQFTPIFTSSDRGYLAITDLCTMRFVRAILIVKISLKPVQIVNIRTSAKVRTIGSLSSDVFERRTSTGSEPFSLLVSLDATVFILPSVLILKETICPKICSKSRLKCAKSPFPVDVRRSKTSLLKLPNIAIFNPPLMTSL